MQMLRQDLHGGEVRAAAGVGGAAAWEAAQAPLVLFFLLDCKQAPVLLPNFYLATENTCIFDQIIRDKGSAIKYSPF